MADRRMIHGGPEAPTGASHTVASATVVVAVVVAVALQWLI